VLQEQKYLPVGSSSAEKSDFRVIAATNKNLEAMVGEGMFREDLLFRLKTFQLELPPLRTRRADIAELTYHFRNIYCRRNKLKRKKLATDYLMLLNQYHWPGNVRELFQAVEYSITEAKDSTILEAAHLPLNIRLSVTKQKLQKNTTEQKEPGQKNLPDQISFMPTMKEDRERAIQNQEKHYLKRLLQLSEGNIKQCCETAGLSRSRLYDLMKKYNLSQKV
jgi:two-component system NtrC family response regulator